MSASNVTLQPRRSEDRGRGEMDWLNSYHTFSFASYHESGFQSFGALRVINEDRVTGGNGFGRHPHNDYEIFSYIISGALKHDDSLGNQEVLRRGDVQFTSTGSGIAHSEYNASQTDIVHFLQMWVRPRARGLPPAYQTKSFPDADKDGKLRLIVSPDGQDNSCVVQNDVKVYASLLHEGQSVTLPLAAGRRAYVHVAMDATDFDHEKRETSVQLNGGATVLRDGDGCFVELKDNKVGGELTLTGRCQGTKPAELVVFDLA